MSMSDKELMIAALINMGLSNEQIMATVLATPDEIASVRANDPFAEFKEPRVRNEYEAWLDNLEGEQSMQEHAWQQAEDDQIVEQFNYMFMRGE